jgi:hypothetical protein
MKYFLNLLTLCNSLLRINGNVLTLFGYSYTFL